jgi:hypothetical protein
LGGKSLRNIVIEELKASEVYQKVEVVERGWDLTISAMHYGTDFSKPEPEYLETLGPSCTII